MNLIHSNTLSVTSGTNPYINNNIGALAGQVAFIHGELKVFDGTTWYSLGLHQTVDLHPEDQVVLKWAREKMRKEAEFAALAAKHEAVRAALDDLQIATEKLQVVINLCESPK